MFHLFLSLNCGHDGALSGRNPSWMSRPQYLFLLKLSTSPIGIFSDLLSYGDAITVVKWSGEVYTDTKARTHR